MQHREFGDGVALEAQSWTFIKPENTLGNAKARPAELNPTYDYVWDSFRSEQRKRQQEVGFPRKPPEYSVIQDEMLEMCFRYQENHWLLNWDESRHEQHPAHVWIERCSHLAAGESEVQHYLSANRSALMNQ